LTTSAIAPLLPDFTDEYGENKNLDIKVSLSKAKFLEEFPKSKPTSISFDKNGVCKV
jgi:hypothetical protein